MKLAKKERKKKRRKKVPDPRPLHPAVQEVIRVGLGVAARGTAHFLDSVLKDVGQAFRAGERKVSRARENLQRKVVESEIDYEPPEKE